MCRSGVRPLRGRTGLRPVNLRNIFLNLRDVRGRGPTGPYRPTAGKFKKYFLKFEGRRGIGALRALTGLRPVNFKKNFIFLFSRSLDRFWILEQKSPNSIAARGYG